MKSQVLARTAESQDEIWVLQHKPVFTLGQAGKEEHILDAHNIPIEKIDRGGQVTYHGPGQLVIYILVDIKRRKLGVRQLVDAIELSIIRTLAEYSIKAKTKPGAPGVYVDGDKIAALGLRIKKGCSYHGFSLNIDMDLTPFTYINPCGYPGLKAIQVKDLLTEPGENLFLDVQEKLLRNLVGNFQ
jgi:lipoyl(octanoyl) transferase